MSRMPLIASAQPPLGGCGPGFGYCLYRQRTARSRASLALFTTHFTSPMSYGPVAKSLLTMPRPIAARRDCDEDELMAQRQPSERHVPTARPP